MGKFADDQMESHKIGGTHFAFSAAKIGSLGATEYTLATIVVDVSGSMEPRYADVEKALKTVVSTCRRSPRADNLLLRVVLFDTEVREVHGFRPLPDCNEADYDGCIPKHGSMTALYDAAFTAIEATSQYAAMLTKQDFLCNAIVFVVSDGGDNASKMPAIRVADAMKKARQAETLESIMPLLIGVDTGGGAALADYLDVFQKEGGFDRFIWIEKADKTALARLAEFASKSMSSQSQAIGSGGPSKAVTF